MAESIKRGDIVRLKSGGPAMTVEWIDAHVMRPYARCVWINTREAFQKACIDLQALEFAATPPEPPHVT
jgi:uncharacterized protein YodC (DUF2158 family)